MKTIGIPFTSSMVLAIRDGRKTQTRRKLKVGDWPTSWSVGWFSSEPEDPSVPRQFGAMFRNERTGADQLVRCPYGEPGTRLYAKEGLYRDGIDVRYRADRLLASLTEAWRWRRDYLPSIHMPRSLARYWLEVVRVDVQRPCDISEEDAVAEGVLPVGSFELGADLERSARDRFRELLLSLHPKDPGTWTRPCWAVEFRRVEESP